MTDRSNRGAFYVPRRELAETIAGRLSLDPLMGSPSGLMLAAPRRTGKSTFLRRDLLPVLKARGDHAVLVDLWSDRKADPGQLIADALAADIAGMPTPAERVARAANAVPIKSISIGGLRAEIGGVADGRNLTLTEALLEIGARAKADVVFIIDEAQQAVTSEAGLDAMFALKAARDAMNQRPEGARLFVLCTGSNRDGLAGLLSTNQQPFYGARVEDFPTLGRPYVEALVAAINPRLAEDNKLDPEDVAQAFRLLGHRPEKLVEVVQQHAAWLPGSAGLKRTLQERADELRARVWDQYGSDFDGLTTLQRAVLEVLIRDGANFAPFHEKTVQRIAGIAGRKTSAQAVQKALDALRDRQLVWRPGRGRYALEDPDMRDWLLARMETG
ncbi:hypothetical protein CEW88_10820 [Alloyangia pacifica]|uniref:ATP-binding protein n=1 Tax=Alloyangia pacifica TaxID=311180 RepID=A0A2U8HE11_9RHOB|nr:MULTISPECIES: hypothetical protein [Roseobacteraceae]AWI84129.1 hypothetical protein CEW88_10820 [Alloyangia pacifica]NDV48228.1 hypothetical protein [Salipiger sp. PrR003]NDW35456.1 hypothetical protein [Salipiger sp. PrR007]